jgi:hypothetical protein
MSGTVIITAEVSRQAREVARKYSNAGRDLRRIIETDYLTDTREDLREIFRGFAPYDEEDRDTFHMAETIEARVRGTRIEVEVSAISPESGFDYLDVTRFGHRGRLYPDKGTFLRWKSGGRVHYARSTAGHHPAVDWVDAALPAAQRAADRSADRIGRKIMVRLA